MFYEGTFREVLHMGNKKRIIQCGTEKNDHMSKQLAESRGK